MKLLKKIRFWIAFLGGKAFLTWYLRTGRRQNDRPGMVSMRLCGDFLQHIAKPPLTIVVTGTNGKTTIAAITAKLLQAQGKAVSYNDWGANHHAGIARCLLEAVSWRNRPVRDAAVIEVDELISPLDVPALRPQYIVVSNLARDSMLRNGHPGYIYQRLEAAIAHTPGATLILNGDDPLSFPLGQGRRRLYFGLGNLGYQLRPNLACDFSVCPRCGGKPVYRYRNYRHMGQVYCPDCGFSSPPRDYQMAEKNRYAMVVEEPEGQATYPLISPELHNVANQMAVVALFREMGVASQTLARQMEQAQIPTSRESRETVGDIQLITHIAKGQNPTAVSTVFTCLSGDPAQMEIILLLDEQYRDPRKVETVAWMYDTDYEFLNRDNIRKIILAGPRYLDHRLRLLLAGIPEGKLVCLEEEKAVPAYVDIHGVEKIFVLHDVNAISRGRAVRDAICRRIQAERRVKP